LKLAEVRVMTHDRRVITLEEWDARHSRRARALQDAHQRLWRITVYVVPTASEEQRALVRAAAEETFGAHTRYVKVTRLRPYLKEVFDQAAALRSWDSSVERLLASSAAKLAAPIASPEEALAWMDDVVGAAEDPP
jgi:hypothetical protein